MKNMTKLLALALAVALLAVSLAACGGGQNASSTPASSAAESSSAESSDSGLGETTTSSAGEVSTDTAVPADFSKPDVTIEYGDFDGIVDFTNAMLAGQYDGKIVKVEGINSKHMSNCGVLEPNAKGDEKRGFTWQLEGAPADMSVYPADDARVILVGQVAVGEYDVRYLMVPADQVQVVE